MELFKDILRHTLNILTIVILCSVAFLFTTYALTYKSLPFVYEYYALLVLMSSVIAVGLGLSGIIFYILGKQMPFRLIVCTLIFWVIAALIFFTTCAAGIINKINSIRALRDYIAQFGNMAVVLFIIFCFLQVVVLPVPGSIAVAAGVALFGPLKCALFSFIGIILGSITGFGVGRWVGYKAVKWIVGKESLDKWLQKLKNRDYLILSIMFLLPMFPDDVLCFVAGLSSMTWSYFVIMIIITRALSVVSTAYSFGFIPFNTWWGILIWLLMIILITAIFWLVCKYSDEIDKFIKNKLKIKK